MDKIHTSAAALTNADKTLKELRDNISAIISKYEATIQNQFGGIDADYQNELMAYFEDLQSLKKILIEFEAGNSKAIRDRLKRMSEYTATAYKKRNIL